MRPKVIRTPNNMTSLLRHFFLLVGIAALLFFLSGDLESRQPSVLDYTVFTIGFVSMLIYFIQSIDRVRKKMGKPDSDRERTNVPSE